MTLDFFQWLGATSIALLALALGLTVCVLTVKISKKQVYVISFTVLALMLAVSALCMIIYSEFGLGPIPSK